MKIQNLSALCRIALCLPLWWLASCEEVDEPTVYDDWQGRNEAFADSIAHETGSRLVGSMEVLDQVPLNQMFALQVWASSTDGGDQYVYCKKIKETADDSARPPYYTETVRVYYYGTLINGERFDGNFEGYSALDRGELDAVRKAPTSFDSPSSFAVSGVISGWSTALQYMKPGDRWMLYIPYQSAYRTTASGSVPAYSALTFDLELVDIVNED